MSVSVRKDSLAAALLGWGVPTCGPTAQLGGHQLLPNQHSKGIPTIQMGRGKQGRRQEDLSLSNS